MLVYCLKSTGKSGKNDYSKPQENEGDIEIDIELK